MSLRPAPRTAWLGAATILVVAALVALGAVARGDFSDTDARILGTLAAVLYTGGALFAGLSVLERGHRGTGWAVVVAAPICFVLLLPAIWTVFESGGDDAWRWAWSAVIALLVGLMLSTAQLLARGDGARLLALVTGSAAGVAATLSIAAIWADTGGDGWVQLIAALWIVAVLAYVLVPVVDRFSAASRVSGERVLATLGDVELVATEAGTLDPRLAWRAPVAPAAHGAGLRLDSAGCGTRSSWCSPVSNPQPTPTSSTSTTRRRARSPQTTRR